LLITGLLLSGSFKFVKSKQSAIKFANKYMKEHDKC